MTGRTLWNIECQGIWGYEISEKFKTLPEVFREAGYATFATGKNDPGKRGHFARAYSAADKILFQGMTGNQYRLPLHDFAPDGNYTDKKPTVSKGKHSAEVYADACIDFLKQQKGADQPFYAYVAFQTPHDPLNVPEDYLAKYDPDEMKLWPPFYTEHPFDNGMLRIRDEKLEPFPRTKAKLRKRLAAYYALVDYTDAQIGRILKTLDELNMTGNTIIVFASDNGLALGSHGLLGKQNIYEHSVRVPLIRSRDQRYKLIEYCVAGARHTQLFDLAKDPFETNNLANSAAHRPTLQRLRELLKRESIHLNDGNVPYDFSRAQGQRFWSAYLEAE